jgi:hypothetical protein
VHGGVSEFRRLLEVFPSKETLTEDFLAET